jgi:hypothetical protein
MELRLSPARLPVNSRIGQYAVPERLDWKLLWDEIEKLRDEYPTITLRLVMSTLLARKEWIEI